MRFFFSLQIFSLSVYAVPAKRARIIMSTLWQSDIFANGCLLEGRPNPNNNHATPELPQLGEACNMQHQGNILSLINHSVPYV